MKVYSFTDAPVEICGLEVIDPEKKRFWRLPDEETALVNDSVRERSKSACGGRVRFRTNSKKVVIRYELLSMSLDICMAVCASAGADVLIGRGEGSRYAGLINPKSYENFLPEITLSLNGSMHQITVNLPRNEKIGGGWIEVDEDAQVLAPLPFARAGKLCFYGSSITEGGCCSRPGNAYTASVARWLDMDYVNYGFSGLAKGEQAMAEIIARRDFSAFIYDYDHNAPDAAYLEKTHELFFQTIRKAHPDLPIVILSRPDFENGGDGSIARREVIWKTYSHAVKSGDKNVYFIDGETLLGTFGREMCTVDGCHPNDLGFFRMAEAVYGKLLHVLA